MHYKLLIFSGFGLGLLFSDKTPCLFSGFRLGLGVGPQSEERLHKKAQARLGESPAEGRLYGAVRGRSQARHSTRHILSANTAVLKKRFTRRLRA